MLPDPSQLHDGDHLRWNEDTQSFIPVPAAQIGNVRTEFSGEDKDDEIMLHGANIGYIKPSGKKMADLARVQTLYAHALGTRIPAGSTLYTAPGFVAAPGVVEYTMPILRAGTVRNFYIRQIDNQEGGGMLECHVRHNGTTDGITIVIPSGAAGPATRSNTEQSFAVVPGDFIGFKFVNQPGSPSAKIGFIAVEVVYD